MASHVHPLAQSIPTYGFGVLLFCAVVFGGTPLVGAPAEEAATPVVVSNSPQPLESYQQRMAFLRKALGLKEGESPRLEEVPTPLVHSLEFTVETADGVLIQCTYTHTPNVQSAPLALLIHDENSNRSTYNALAARLRDRGISTLSYDMRGFGGSTTRKDGSVILYENYRNEQDTPEFRNMVFDLEAVLDWAEKQGVVDAQGVYVIASRMGATVGCWAGVEESRRLKGMMLTNVNANYRGISLADELERVQGLPILMIASEADPYGKTVPRTLNRANKEVRPFFSKADKNGIQLLEEDVTFRVLVDFMNGIMPAISSDLLEEEPEAPR